MVSRVVAPRLSVENPTDLKRMLAELRRPNERRRNQRTEFDYALRLEPIGVGADAPMEGLIVRGKDLSDTGIGIAHDCPLPFRKVRLYAADPELNAMGLAHLELDVVLRWCRFLAPGQYESGGRLIQAASQRRVA